jgi:hypothetical protein
VVCRSSGYRPDGFVAHPATGSGLGTNRPDRMVRIGGSALALNGLTIVIGIGSNLVTIALFALSLVVLVYAGLLVILGWLRPIHRS